MKNILTAIVLLSLFLCSAAFGNTEVFAAMAKAPKTSKAIIKRGKMEIPVDLAETATKSKIKDYDVILLDEGVYSTLGDSGAKYVRVIGKGQGKTFITSMTNVSLPMTVNSTEFWDLTMADAQFKVADVSGLWAINVEFAGVVLVSPASMDKTPAFAIRSVFSNLQTEDGGLNTILKMEDSPAALLAYEDKLDRDESLNLKERQAHKGLIARGANYLYQTKNIKPQFDIAKYNQLTKQAKEAKKKGHHYVSMLYWAEADRLSGHSRFDEVLKEITPLNQVVSQECGCTVEGQGLAVKAKTAIEEKLYAKVPVTSLPGPCKIQTLHVSNTGKGNKDELITNARLQASLDRAAAFQSRENAFKESAIAHASGKEIVPAEEDFVVGAPIVATLPYTLVADVEMQGRKKTYSSDVVVGKSDEGSFISQNIVDPIAKAFTTKFAAKIKAATAKMTSTDLLARTEGFIVNALYGGDLTKQSNYEDLHEQQFGRKLTTAGAASSVFAY